MRKIENNKAHKRQQQERTDFHSLFLTTTAEQLHYEKNNRVKIITLKQQKENIINIL